MAKYNAATTNITRQAAVQTNKELLDNGVLYMYKQIANDNLEFDKRINAIQQYCINYINSNEGDSEKFKSILTNMFTVYSDVTSEKVSEEFYNTLNSFFIITDNSKTFMKDLNTVKKAVYYENYGQEAPLEVSLKLDDTLLLFSKLQSEIKNGAYILNSISEKEKVIDLNAEEYVLENMYILPMKNLFTKNTSLHIAWFCFGFAALIDGLTLLFALSHRGNPKTLLAKRNSELVKNNEELTEELLLSSLILHPVGDENKSTVELSLEHLAKFLSLFKITNIGMESGYSLYCSVNKLKDYHIFLSVLCQFNLARIVPKEDFELLKVTPTIDEFNHAIREENSFQALEETAATYENEDGSYILLKTKFIIWVNKKFTIASSNEKLHSTIRTVLKAIE